MNRSRLLGYAQLLRLPNVFTAFADICLGACVAGYVAQRPEVFVLVLLASGCLYLAGMALNDFFDRTEDAQTQPFRPIPSGRIGLVTALFLGLGLLVVGNLSAVVVSVITEPLKPFTPALAAFIITGAVLLYDVSLKRTVIGPIVMGTCRWGNVLLGLTAGRPGAVSDELALHLAAVVGVYIVGVTWFARTEETSSSRRNLIGAALVMLAAMGLAVTVPVHLPPGTSPVYFPYLVVAFTVYVGSAVVAAIRNPDAKSVQAAVKRCILGLVLLDATLATAFVGAWGLLIGLLLLPARFLGRWVYST